MNADRFLKFLKFEKRYSSHTITAYSKDLEQFFEYIQKNYECNNIKEVTHFYVRSWMVSLMDVKTHPKTVNRKISTLKSFFKFMLREKAVDRNPMTRVVAPKVPKKLPEYIQKDSMDFLLRHVDYGEGYEGIRNRTIIELLYNTGMRRAELTGLKEQSIDFGNETVKVLGKRNKERIIPLMPTMITLLKEYLTAKKNQQKACKTENDFLLLDIKCKPMNDAAVYKIVKHHLAQATTSSKKSPHILRHTFATHMLNNGADINAIKELLGHASLAATQVYTHNTIDKLKKIHKQAHPKA